MASAKKRANANAKVNAQEAEAFSIMSGRTRHAGQQHWHRRTIMVDTMTAEYFDLTGKSKAASARMAHAIIGFVQDRYAVWEAERGKDKAFHYDAPSIDKNDEEMSSFIKAFTKALAAAPPKAPRRRGPKRGL